MASDDDDKARPVDPPDRQPKTARSYEDRVAFRQAFANVRPLKGRDRVAKNAPPSGPPSPAGPRNEAADEEARQRLDALVGGGERFKIHRSDDFTTGLRVGMHPSFLAELDDARLRADAECDLHGLTGEQARREVTRFVREQARRGARVVLIIHGKGRHSAGRGVLLDHAIEALTKGGAPLVAAFHTAPRALGGAGALAVRLSSRKRKL